jgi:hypothetical protein
MWEEARQQPGAHGVATGRQGHGHGGMASPWQVSVSGHAGVGMLGLVWQRAKARPRTTVCRSRVRCMHRGWCGAVRLGVRDACVHGWCGDMQCQ